MGWILGWRCFSVIYLFRFCAGKYFFRPLASNASPVRIFSLQAGRPSALTLRALVFPVYPPSRPTRAHFTPRRVSTSAAKSRMAPLCVCVVALHVVSTPLCFFKYMNSIQSPPSRSHLSVGVRGSLYIFSVGPEGVKRRRITQRHS